MRGTPVRFEDFTGGVNTTSATFLVKENECRDCRNVVSTTRGSVKKRNGNTTFATLSQLGMSVFPLSATTSHSLIVTQGTSLLSVGTGGAVSTITGALTMTFGKRWCFVQAPASGGQGPLYGMNGLDTPIQWTGTGNAATWVATSGTVPNGTMCVTWKNRVFVAGVPANPSRLYWSDIGDPRSWPVANVVDLDPSDGDVITGLAVVGPYLAVFKQHKLFIVYDDATGANRTISPNVGTSSHRSIAASPEGLYFLSHDQGVFLFDGSSLKPISQNVDATLNTVNAAQRQNACGAYYANHYYLSVCVSGSLNNLTLDFDAQLGSWWLHSMGYNQFAVFDTGTSLDLHAVQAGNSLLDKCFVSGVTQDNGTNFAAYWVSHWITVSGMWRRMYIQEPYRRKRARRLHLDGSGQLDAYLAVDYTTAPTLLDADVFDFSAGGQLFGGSGVFGGPGVFGDTPGQAYADIYSLGVARAFSVQIAGTHSNPFEMDAFTLNMTQRQN